VSVRSEASLGYIVSSRPAELRSKILPLSGKQKKRQKRCVAIGVGTKALEKCFLR
jgi:hypothetical protein